MRCGKPKVVGAGRSRREYPCLRCASCRASGRSELAQLLKLELACHAQSLFVTLSFAPEHYPRNRSEVKRMFARAVRGVPYRTFMVMERGDRGGRVHFHLLVFGQPFLGSFEYWDRQWPFGRTSVDIAKSGSPGYLARYILKEYESEALVFHPDGLGEPLKRFPRKPGLGRLAALAMARTELSDAQRRFCLLATHDVSPVHRYDGRVVRTPRRVREQMRAALGLPSSSGARFQVQSERRAWLAAQPGHLAKSEKRRVVLAARDELLASRERSSRVYRDPSQVIAERLFAEAVASGAYETRAARRRRLAEEAEIEGAADLLLALSLGSAKET